MKETDLAKKFVEYLSDFDLYFEVKTVGSIVDIVAVKNPIKIAIEVKTSFSIAVIEQALNNKEFFHYSYVAVPKSRNQNMALKICSDYGIGVLVCEYHNFNSSSFPCVHEIVKPKLNRHAMIRYVNEQEYNKKSIPGSVNNRMTPFKHMVDDISEYLVNHDGSAFKDVWDNCAITYNTISAFKSCMYGWCNQGIIKKFYIKKSRLYLKK